MAQCVERINKRLLQLKLKLFAFLYVERSFTLNCLKLLNPDQTVSQVNFCMSLS